MSAQLLALAQTASALRQPRKTRHTAVPSAPAPGRAASRQEGWPALALPRTSTVPPASRQPYAGIRLIDVIGALSRALDMAEGQPVGHSIRTAMIGMRIGAVVGLEEEDRGDLFFALLLKDLGSSANAALLTGSRGGDDLLIKAARRLADGNDHSFVSAALRPTSGERSRWRQAWAALREMITHHETERKAAALRADKGASIAAMLAMPRSTCGAIAAIDEHWDGNGLPHGLRGDAIPLLARIVSIAQCAEVFERAFDVGTAFSVIHRRAGQWFDPELVAALDTMADDNGFWSELRHADALSALRRYDPPTRVVYANELRLDTVAEAFAKVIDAKSPFTARHSHNVSFLATRTAMELDMPRHKVRALRRAALLHDIGKLGVANRILDKTSPLTSPERLQMERHTRFTFEVLRDVPRFARFAMLAASHHERLDGSGYHLGLRDAELSLPARVLAAADVCEALSAARPYRAAMPLDGVFRNMKDATAAGLLCPVAVGALIGWFEGLPDHPVTLPSDEDSTSLFGI